VVDEQDAFEMVHLVLEAGREQVVDFLFVALPSTSCQRARMREGRSTSA
jgi:hypothetical protein